MQHNQQLATQAFIRAVADLGIARLNSDDKAQASKAMLTYGAGKANLRGVTYFNAWKQGEDDSHAFVEVCAMGQSDPVQLAGTTLHEIGHVLAGHAAGHSKDWKAACDKLGLRRIKAAGTEYRLAMFHPDIRPAIVELINKLEKAAPAFRITGVPGVKGAKLAPCPSGIGTRGGTSRGAGSGSRMLKLDCTACNAVWRMSGKWAEQAKQCPCCGSQDINKPE